MSGGNSTPTPVEYTITLHVTCAEVTNQTKDTCCNFGQSSGTNEEFNINVAVGDKIKWKGQYDGPATTPTPVINITKIQKERDSEIFGAPNGVIQGSGSPETVEGTVQSDTSGEDEVYTIFFNINGGQQLKIDPKITVQPRA
ncbi:MAG: hypothetical protein WBM43_08645 [Flavobacteriaceae bacterium]